MIKDKVVSLINYLLSGFFVGDAIRKEDVKFGIYHIVLEDLKFKSDLLDSCQLPVSISFSRIGKFEMYFPWLNMGSEPVVIRIEKVLILLKSNLPDSTSGRGQSARQAGLKSGSWFSKVLSPFQSYFKWAAKQLSLSILGKLNITIQDVHIRFEDYFLCSSMSACGLTCEKMTILPTEDDSDNSGTKICDFTISVSSFSTYWNPIFKKDFTTGPSTMNGQLQTGEVDFCVIPFAIYSSLSEGSLKHDDVAAFLLMNTIPLLQPRNSHNSPSEQSVSSFDSSHNCLFGRPLHHYIFTPTSIQCRLTVSLPDSSDGSTIGSAKSDLSLSSMLSRFCIVCDVNIERSALILEDRQVSGAVELVYNILNCRSAEMRGVARPSSSPLRNAAVWWKYAIICVAKDNRKAKIDFQMLILKKRIELVYMDLYKRKLLFGVSVKEVQNPLTDQELIKHCLKQARNRFTRVSTDFVGLLDSQRSSLLDYIENFGCFHVHYNPHLPSNLLNCDENEQAAELLLRQLLSQYVDPIVSVKEILEFRDGIERELFIEGKKNPTWWDVGEWVPKVSDNNKLTTRSSDVVQGNANSNHMKESQSNKSGTAVFRLNVVSTTVTLGKILEPNQKCAIPFLECDMNGMSMEVTTTKPTTASSMIPGLNISLSVTNLVMHEIVMEEIRLSQCCALIDCSYKLLMARKDGRSAAKRIISEGKAAVHKLSEVPSLLAPRSRRITKSLSLASQMFDWYSWTDIGREGDKFKLLPHDSSVEPVFTFSCYTSYVEIEGAENSMPFRWKFEIQANFKPVSIFFIGPQCWITPLYGFVSYPKVIAFSLVTEFLNINQFKNDVKKQLKKDKLKKNKLDLLLQFEMESPVIAIALHPVSLSSSIVVMEFSHMLMLTDSLASPIVANGKKRTPNQPMADFILRNVNQNDIIENDVEEALHFDDDDDLSKKERRTKNLRNNFASESFLPITSESMFFDIFCYSVSNVVVSVMSVRDLINSDAKELHPSQDFALLQRFDVRSELSVSSLFWDSEIPIVVLDVNFPCIDISISESKLALLKCMVNASKIPVYDYSESVAGSPESKSSEARESVKLEMAVRKLVGIDRAQPHTISRITQDEDDFEEFFDLPSRNTPSTESYEDDDSKSFKSVRSMEDLDNGIDFGGSLSERIAGYSDIIKSLEAEKNGLSSEILLAEGITGQEWRVVVLKKNLSELEGKLCNYRKFYIESNMAFEERQINNKQLLSNGSEVPSRLRSGKFLLVSDFLSHFISISESANVQLDLELKKRQALSGALYPLPPSFSRLRQREIIWLQYSFPSINLTLELRSEELRHSCLLLSMHDLGVRTRYAITISEASFALGGIHLIDCTDSGKLKLSKSNNRTTLISSSTERNDSTHPVDAYSHEIFDDDDNISRKNSVDMRRSSDPFCKIHFAKTFQEDFKECNIFSMAVNSLSIYCNDTLLDTLSRFIRSRLKVNESKESSASLKSMLGFSSSSLSIALDYNISMDNFIFIVPVYFPTTCEFVFATRKVTCRVKFEQFDGVSFILMTRLQDFSVSTNQEKTRASAIAAEAIIAATPTREEFYARLPVASVTKFEPNRPNNCQLFVGRDIVASSTDCPFLFAKFCFRSSDNLEELCCAAQPEKSEDMPLKLVTSVTIHVDPILFEISYQTVDCLKVIINNFASTLPFGKSSADPKVSLHYQTLVRLSNVNVSGYLKGLRTIVGLPVARSYFQPCLQCNRFHMGKNIGCHHDVLFETILRDIMSQLAKPGDGMISMKLSLEHVVTRFHAEWKTCTTACRVSSLPSIADNSNENRRLSGVILDQFRAELKVCCEFSSIFHDSENRNVQESKVNLSNAKDIEILVGLSSIRFHVLPSFIVTMAWIMSWLETSKNQDAPRISLPSFTVDIFADSFQLLLESELVDSNSNLTQSEIAKEGIIVFYFDCVKTLAVLNSDLFSLDFHIAAFSAADCRSSGVIFNSGKPRGDLEERSIKQRSMSSFATPKKTTSERLSNSVFYSGIEGNMPMRLIENGKLWTDSNQAMNFRVILPRNEAIRVSYLMAGFECILNSKFLKRQIDWSTFITVRIFETLQNSTSCCVTEDKPVTEMILPNIILVDMTRPLGFLSAKTEPTTQSLPIMINPLIVEQQRLGSFPVFEFQLMKSTLWIPCSSPECQFGQDFVMLSMDLHLETSFASLDFRSLQNVVANSTLTSSLHRKRCKSNKSEPIMSNGSISSLSKRNDFLLDESSSVLPKSSEMILLHNLISPIKSIASLHLDLPGASVYLDVHLQDKSSKNAEICLPLRSSIFGYLYSNILNPISSSFTTALNIKKAKTILPNPVENSKPSALLAWEVSISGGSIELLIVESRHLMADNKNKLVPLCRISSPKFSLKILHNSLSTKLVASSLFSTYLSSIVDQQWNPLIEPCEVDCLCEIHSGKLFSLDQITKCEISLSINDILNVNLSPDLLRSIIFLSNCFRSDSESRLTSSALKVPFGDDFESDKRVILFNSCGIPLLLADVLTHEACTAVQNDILLCDISMTSLTIKNSRNMLHDLLKLANGFDSNQNSRFTRISDYLFAFAPIVDLWQCTQLHIVSTIQISNRTRGSFVLVLENCSHDEINAAESVSIQLPSLSIVHLPPEFCEGSKSAHLSQTLDNDSTYLSTSFLLPTPVHMLNETNRRKRSSIGIDRCQTLFFDGRDSRHWYYNAVIENEVQGTIIGSDAMVNRFTVAIESPTSFVNLLVKDITLEVSVADMDKQESVLISVPSGSDYHWHFSNDASELTFVIHTEGFAESDAIVIPSKDSRNEASPTIIAELPGFRGNNLRVMIDVEVNQGVRVVKIWVPFWIVNCTEQDITINDEKSSEIDSINPAMSEPDNSGLKCLVKQGITENSSSYDLRVKKRLPTNTGLLKNLDLGSTRTSTAADLPLTERVDKAASENITMCGFSKLDSTSCLITIMTKLLTSNLLLRYDDSPQTSSTLLFHDTSSLESNLSFVFSASICRGVQQFNVTNMVVIREKYFFENKTACLVDIEEVCGRRSRTLVIKPNGILPFHPRNIDFRLIRVKFTGNEWNWSGKLSIDRCGKRLLRIDGKNMYQFSLLQVEVKMNDYSINIKFSKPIDLFPPIRVENYSLDLLRVFQPSVIDPNERNGNCVTPNIGREVLKESSTHPNQDEEKKMGFHLPVYHIMEYYWEEPEDWWTLRIEKFVTKSLWNKVAEGSWMTLCDIVVDKDRPLVRVVEYERLPSVSAHINGETIVVRVSQEGTAELIEPDPCRISLGISVKINALGVSVLDDLCEVMYIFQQNLSLDASIDLMTEKLNRFISTVVKFTGKISSIQVDNQLIKTAYPVMLFGDSPSLSCFGQFISRVDSDMIFLIISDINCKLSSMVLAVDANSIIRIISAFRFAMKDNVSSETIFEAIRHFSPVMQHSKIISCSPDLVVPMKLTGSSISMESRCRDSNIDRYLRCWKFKNVEKEDINQLAQLSIDLSLSAFKIEKGLNFLTFFQSIDISDVDCLFSLDSNIEVVRNSEIFSSPFLLSLSNFFGSMVGNIRELSLHVQGFSYSIPSFLTVNELAIALNQHLSSQKVSLLASILGSSDVTGRFVLHSKAFAKTIQDIFLASSHGDVQNFVVNVFSGVGSILRTTAFGLTDGPSSITRSLANVIQSSTVGGLELKVPGSENFGILAPPEDISSGFIQGVVGVIADPVMSISRHGMGGIILGSYRGAWGLLARPMYGILRSTSSQLSYFSSFCTGKLDVQHPERIRIPRSVGHLVKYDIFQSTGDFLVRYLLYNAPYSEKHIWHGSLVSKPKQFEIVLLTTARLFLLSHKGSRDIHDIIVEKVILLKEIAQFVAEGVLIRLRSRIEEGKRKPEVREVGSLTFMRIDDADEFCRILSSIGIS